MKKWLFVSLSGMILCFPMKAGAEIYRWTDDKGVEHFTNNKKDIPAKYADQIDFTAYSDEEDESGEKTVINFDTSGSSVQIGATLNSQHPVIFNLDTGATETLITEGDAQKLGIKLKTATKVRTKLADGRDVEFSKVKLKSIKVGNAEVRNIYVLVGPIRLLGLSFLNNFKMTMDNENGQLILENPRRGMQDESVEASEDKALLRAEYEANIEKSRINIEQVQKNIEILESEIESLRQQKMSYQDAIDQAAQNDPFFNTSEYDAAMQRSQLAIENRELQIESYRKDIELLEKNINYYQNWRYKLK